MGHDYVCTRIKYSLHGFTLDDNTPYYCYPLINTVYGRVEYCNYLSLPVYFIQHILFHTSTYSSLFSFAQLNKINKISTNLTSNIIR